MTSRLLFLFLSFLFWTSASKASLSADEFHKAMNSLLFHYSGEVQEKHKEVLKLVGDYENYVNLDLRARILGNSVIALNGGIAHRDDVDADTFLLILCHEIGHSLGGAPVIMWRSTEGQADYFATLKCTKRIWKDEDNVSVIATREVPPIVRNKCESQFKNLQEAALCMRSALAAKKLVTALQAQHNPLETPVEFTTPAPPTTSTVPISSGYPSNQCRLDTMVAGALCVVPDSEKHEDFDPTIGTCATPDVVGHRPICWFKYKSK